MRSSIAFAGGKICFGGQDRTFYVCDATTGARLWSYMSWGVIESSPAIANGEVYFGGTNGWVYCLAERVGTVSTTVSCKVVPGTVVLGLGATIQGEIFPGVLWNTITLTYTRPDGTTFGRDIASKADGQYFDFYTPDIPGSWTVKASWAGTTGYSGATSSTVNFTVTGTLPPVASTIDSWVDPKSLPLNGTQYTRGGILPTTSGATVTLTYTKPDGTTTTKTVTTASDGTYEDTYTVDVKGAWTVKASWAGDATHKATTSNPAFFTVTEAVTPPPTTGGGGGIPTEVIYGGVGVVIIAIVAVAAYLFMKKKK
jgi:hypothetical protein